jgi:hypothetical protein
MSRDTGDEHDRPAYLGDAARRSRADQRIDAVIAQTWAGPPEAMERLALLLECYAANREAFDEIAAVLEGGGVKHGGGGLGPDEVQSVKEHVEAMCRHADAARSDMRHFDALRFDESGRLTVAHVAGRCVLAMTRARAEGRR